MGPLLQNNVMQDNLLWENLLLVLHMWMSTMGWLFSQGVSFCVIYLGRSVTFNIGISFPVPSNTPNYYRIRNL